MTDNTPIVDDFDPALTSGAEEDRPDEPVNEDDLTQDSVLLPGEGDEDDYS